MDRIELMKEIVGKLDNLNDGSLKTVLKAANSCIVVQQLNELKGVSAQELENLLAS